MLKTDMKNKQMLKLPQIIYGTWGLELGAQTIDSVNSAISAGYKGIDAAFSYSNDFYTGKAIKNCGVPREELFITNKVWNTFRGEEAVIEACKKSLKLMKLEYFDLYLIHWPVSIKTDHWEEQNYNTWMGMEALYRSGLVKGIGVSNFLPHHFESLISYGIKTIPMVNQIEHHVGYTQDECVKYCKEKGIDMEAWSPLGSGVLLKDDRIQGLAKKYYTTAALICLRYVVQNGLIPVVRSANEERIRQNLQVFDFELSDEDMSMLNSIKNVGYSGFHPDENQPQ